MLGRLHKLQYEIRKGILKGPRVIKACFIRRILVALANAIQTIDNEA